MTDPLQPLYFNRAAEPIERDEWLRLTSDPKYRLVAHDVVGCTDIQTAWAGLPLDQHSDPPLIFETVAAGDVEPFKQRYATEPEAIAGHAEAVATLRAAADASDPRVFRALSELADALTAQGRRLYAVAVETSGPVPDLTSPGEVRVVHVRNDGRPWAEVIAAETLARQQEAKP